MFSQTRGTPAPIDDPLGLGKPPPPTARAGCCPGTPTSIPAVLAWEQRELLRRLDLLGRRRGPARARHAARVAARRRERPADPRRRRRAARFANVCRHRGHELLPCGGAATASAHRLPLPRVDLPAGRVAARAPRLPRRRRLRPVGARPARAAGSRTGTAGSSSTRPGRPATSPSTSASLEDIVAPYAPETLRVLRRARVRDRGQLEGHRRELPGVLPLLDDPPRALPGEPAGRAARTSTCPGTGSAAGWTCATTPTTMSLDGKSAARRIDGLAEHEQRTVMYIARVPEPADQPAPRLRDDPPADAAGRRPHVRRVRVAVPGRSRCDARASTRRTPSTSGTSPTGRTGRRASRCSAACPRSTPCPGPLAPEEDGVQHFVTRVARGYLGAG